MTPHAIISAASRAATKGKIRCPNCGHLNESGAEKCAKCGYPLKGSEKKAGVRARAHEDDGDFAERALHESGDIVSRRYANPAQLAKYFPEKEPYLKTPLEKGLMLGSAGAHLVGAGLGVADLIHDMKTDRQLFRGRTLLAGPAAGTALGGLALLLAHLRRKREAQAEKKAGVIVGPVNASHSTQDLEDERASIRHLLESKKMWEGDRHTGRFTPRGAGTFLGALGGTLGAFRGATLPADSSITGTRLGDALLAGAGSAVLGSSVGWAGAKYGLRNRMARVEAALAEKQQAEKKAGFWGDLTGKNYKKELGAAAAEIRQGRSNFHDALAQAARAAERVAIARRDGTPKPHLEAAALDASKRLARAAEGYNSLPWSPQTHPKSQEAWRRMAKARGGAALGLGALGLGAYGLYRATRPKQQAEKKAAFAFPRNPPIDLSTLPSKIRKAVQKHDPEGPHSRLSVLEALREAQEFGTISLEERIHYSTLLEKVASVEYRGHTFPGYNVPIKSSRPEKKKMVLAKKGDEVRLIHFGQQGYKHNYSDAAKKNYLARSAGIRGKGGLTKDDKFSANYWARRELWPKNEPADGTAKDRSKTASGGVSENFAHGAELTGLGVLSLPAAAHLYHNWKEKRLVSKDSLIPAAELAGLGILSLPSLAHFGSRASKRQAIPSGTHAPKTASGGEDLLLGRLGRAVGNTFQKYPAPTAAAVYGVTKIPAIGKAWREGKTDEAMPVGYAPALAAGTMVRHGDPATAKYLVRRALGPV